MTPRETLEKYGLKTDVKSIRERFEKAQKSLFFYIEIVEKVLLIDPVWNSEEEYNEKNALAVELRSADLALLCELAEKGEELEAIKKRAEEERVKAMGFIEDYKHLNDIAICQRETEYNNRHIHKLTDDLELIDFIIKGEGK